MFGNVRIWLFRLFFHGDDVVNRKSVLVFGP